MDRQSFIEHSQCERNHWWFTGRRAIIRTLVAAVLPRGSGRDRIVEVGCGTGATIADLADDYQCVGAEISRDALLIARENYPHSQFVHFDHVGELAEMLSQANVVLLLDVLEHIEDDQAFWNTLAELLPTGAHVIVTVPADPKLWSRHDVAMFHFRRYTAESLQALWANQPFQTHLFSGMNWRLAPIIRLLRRLPHRSDTGRERCTDLSVPPRWINHSLHRVFASEATTLRRMFAADIPSSPPYGSGISYVAVLQKVDVNE